MNKEIINVVLASDNNYAQPLGTTLYSMFDNFRSNEHILKITILDGGITEENKEKITAIGKKFTTDISFKKMSNDDFKGFPLVQYFSIVMYYRLLIPVFFENKADKVIYLDSDTLVLGNIASLYKTNIDDFYLGAVRDFVESLVLTLNCPFYKYIKKYFNSGVLLMNIKKMNEDGFVKKSFDFLNDHSSELLYPDQDTLNYLCIDNWYELNREWNTQLDRSAEKINPQPSILHYTTSFKPWYFSYHNYYQKYYMGYLKKAWPNYTIKPVPFKTVIKQTLKFIPYSIPAARLFKKIFNIQ